jgi:CheY-like chemotaxis protein
MKKEKFDSVFLDMSMPDFSGLDVIAALEKEGVLKDQRIIIFTASSISNDAIDELLTKDGVDKCLRKPVVLSELLAVINN